MDRLTLPRSAFTSSEAALSREWLVTNGLGGYASGTIAQANTRRYHGLLVAALSPPLGRTVLLAKADVVLDLDGVSHALGCNEFADGTLVPRGHERLVDFHLEGTTPVWDWTIGELRLTQRLWMSQGRNTTWLQFTVRGSRQPLRLRLTPLTTARDYHSHAHAGGWPQIELLPRGCNITAFAGARPLRLSCDRGQFVPAPDWYWHFHHRVERERGLDADEDLFRPGHFEAELADGDTLTFVFDAETDALPRASAEGGTTAWHREQARQSALVAGLDTAPPWVRQLTLAADQFLVARGKPGGECGGTTVIAGYPWFGDWGRDTMIALPGLTLATGRLADAASILRTFADHVSDGLLPNRFPDGEDAPEYNTVDATLWYFHAVACYLEAAPDSALLTELYPVLTSIIDCHCRGTRYEIGVDPADGLLYAGQRGVQLTWMDAKVGDWVVTPRIGKAVEINALWHFALSHMQKWSRTLGDRAASRRYGIAAERVADAFAARFWNEATGGLYDVIDGPDGESLPDGRRVDASLRPNQLFAVSLGTGLLDPARQRSVVELCGRELLTPLGLRSLAASHPDYAPRYEGGPGERDARYHQGTVWSWLLGPYAIAHASVHGRPDDALELLDRLVPHLGDACLGQISEIFDAAPPHAPRGCFAQAWSVAEMLRAWHTLTRARDRVPHNRRRRNGP